MSNSFADDAEPSKLKRAAGTTKPATAEVTIVETPRRDERVESTKQNTASARAS
ncbi:MAG: hypothetical protein AAF747_09495 [Planctomycetota bacterium]